MKIKFNSDDIDITDIIKQIQEKIKDEEKVVENSLENDNKCYCQTVIKNLQLGDKIDCDIKALNNNHLIKYWWDFPKENKLSQKFKGFIKKTIQKYIYFYFKHVFDQQNAYNTSTMYCINDLYDYCSMLEKRCDELSKEINSLKPQNTVQEPTD